MALPGEIGKYYNQTMGRKQLRQVVADAYRYFQDANETARIVNEIKKVGFEFSTRGGMSIAVDDVVMSGEKEGLLHDADERAEKIERQYRRGLVTEQERLRELELIWNTTRDELAKHVEEGLRGQNSVFMMADSGAKGNMNQISQMAGMRGLVLDPKGEIIDIPIRSNFREGLTVLEYFLSTHGARKGLADTALRTADSGYLTRRLVDVSQDVIVTIDDCGTENGLWITRGTDGEQLAEDEFRATILGRVLLSPAVHPETGEVIADRGEELTDRLEAEDGSVRDLVREVMDAGVNQLHVRSVMMCEATHGVCVACYGRNLASGRLVEQGEAVGIIAAQSIGEPGTQLTMRTFHTGGVARADITTGLPRVEELFEARAPKGAAVLADREGVISVENTDTGRVLAITSTDVEQRVYPLEPGWDVALADGDMVLKDKTVLAVGPDDQKLYSAIEGPVLPRRPDDLRSEREGRAGRVLGAGGIPGLRRRRRPGLPGPAAHRWRQGPAQGLADARPRRGPALHHRRSAEGVSLAGRQHQRQAHRGDLPADAAQSQHHTSGRHRLSAGRADRPVRVQSDQRGDHGAGWRAGHRGAGLARDHEGLVGDGLVPSAASFQETTRVLTEAAINGKVDNLRGLKENVIIGKLIPAGSGFGVAPGVEADFIGEGAPGGSVAVLPGWRTIRSQPRSRTWKS